MAQGSTVFTYTVQDYLNQKATVTLYVSYDGLTMLMNNMFSEWTRFGALIAACLDGAIVDGRISVEMIPVAAWNTGKPVAGVPVGKLGGLDFNQANVQYVQATMLPAYIHTGWTQGEVPDSGAGTPVAALATAMTTAGGIGEVSNVSKYMNLLTSLRDTFQGARKYRRQLPKSRKVDNPG